MMKMPGSDKHVQIAKARSNVVTIVVIATIVTVFCLASTKALLSQASYQKRVINSKQATNKQLQSNLQSANTLVTQYNEVFEGSNPTNLIGGKNDKSANAVPPNGDNARIVLDALPSKYDFPALITSVSNILTVDGVSNAGISGTDASATVDNTATAIPHAIPIQLSVSGTASYQAIQKVVHDLERSIRPFDVTNVQLSGSESNMSFSLTVVTYYQQPKSLDTTIKEIH